MATNRIDSLDPALIRPGRIDRKIEFPLPDVKTKRRIFSIHTNRMTLSDDVSLEEYINSKEELSGADIKVFLRLHTCHLPFFKLSFRSVSFVFSHRPCDYEFNNQFRLFVQKQVY